MIPSNAPSAAHSKAGTESGDNSEQGANPEDPWYKPPTAGVPSNWGGKKRDLAVERNPRVKSRAAKAATMGKKLAASSYVERWELKHW